MDFIEELKWRGILNNSTPGVEDYLKNAPAKAYIGFDPTAPSLTIGNYVQIMLLKLFQLAGHQPIVLMGGATGRVGDPSGKDEERQLKTFEELDHNLSYQQKQFYKFLDTEGPNKVLFVNNLDFYKEMNVLEFLRSAGKTLTINYMMSKDSVKTRIETGLSFTEFSYQLLQAYDFQTLYNQENCKLQMGGSDQWGNITSGTEFIRKNIEGKAYALTVDLLTKSDGSKFGKSEGGNIWLDPNLTSPYKFYQFWINANDADLPSYFRYFTLKSKEEIEAMEKEYAEDINAQKRMLAEELTCRVHSKEDYDLVVKVSQIVFNKKANNDSLKELNAADLEVVANELPRFEVKKSLLTAGVNIVDLLAEHTSIMESKGKVRQAIKGNAIAINKNKIASHEDTIGAEVLLQDKFTIVEHGKKFKFMIVAED